MRIKATAILTGRLTIYIAASFKHLHGVRLLGNSLRALGCQILDWTAKASPPAGLTSAQRRIWMDTDQDGGEVYAFCREACLTADLVIYYGESGQDAGVEIGIASACGTPILGIAGPLESPGLMLHGAVTAWVDSVEQALLTAECLARLTESRFSIATDAMDSVAKALAPKLRHKIGRKIAQKHIDADHSDR